MDIQTLTILYVSACEPWMEFYLWSCKFLFIQAKQKNPRDLPCWNPELDVEILLTFCSLFRTKCAKICVMLSVVRYFKKESFLLTYNPFINVFGMGSI